MNKIVLNSTLQPVFRAAGFLAALLVTVAFSHRATAETAAQSYAVPLDGRTVTLYPPEVDTMDGTDVSGRSALSVARSGKPPVFGAARLSAVVQQTKRTVKLTKLLVEEIKLPKSTEDVPRLTAELNRSLQGAVWEMPTDQFEARLGPGLTGRQQGTFDDDAPKVYYEEAPAVLVWIDGKPKLKASKNPRYKTVVNTAYFIVQDTKENCYFLKGGRWWFRADTLKKEFIVTAPPSTEIQNLAAAAFTAEDQDADQEIADLSYPPKVIVTFEPAELVVVNGAPEYVSVEGTNLLYVDNTESNLLVDVNSQQFFLLLAGRWYASASLKGPWRYVPPGRLPADFAKIPDGSGAADVRISVPGTPQAADAALEAAVPEVAAVNRTDTALTVRYDGAPKLQQIEGTQVFYALNSSATVLRINGRFYAVDNGIWFQSAGPHGPWSVATIVPAEVQEIPPSAPVYYVRYVYVYDYTPSVVYVGYTPGYYCSYVYHGAVVYGTGYHYRPWWGAVYYPRPVTFGFGAHYNPYTGWWGYPVGVTFGWIGVRWYAAPFGFWGPAGYMYGYRHGYYHRHRHGYYHGYRHGYRRGYTAGRRAGYRASAGGRPARGTVYARHPKVRPVSGIRRDFAKPKPSPYSGTRMKNRNSSSGFRNIGSAGRPYNKAARPSRPSSKTDASMGSRNKSRFNSSRTGAKPDRAQPSGNMFHKNKGSNSKSRYNNRTGAAGRPQTGSRSPSNAKTRSPRAGSTQPQRSPQRSPSYKSPSSGSSSSSNARVKSRNSKPAPQKDSSSYRKPTNSSKPSKSPSYRSPSTKSRSSSPRFSPKSRSPRPSSGRKR